MVGGRGGRAFSRRSMFRVEIDAARRRSSVQEVVVDVAEAAVVGPVALFGDDEEERC